MRRDQKAGGRRVADIFDWESNTPRTPGVFSADESQGQAQAFHSLDEHVAQYIRHVIQHTNGRISGKNGAASILGLPPTTLWSKMRKLKINSNLL
ncbi:MAG: helix-turn-helix domain-containing protein [Desulfovibrio fairfieldensis]